MPPFAAAIVAAILGNVGSDVARAATAAAFRRRIDGLYGRRSLGAPAVGEGPPRQTPTPRVFLTPAVSPAPPVPGPADRPLDPGSLAYRLRRFR
jgi:hypothetical protein